MSRLDAPATFRGQLQRGRGKAFRNAPGEPGAGTGIYGCLIDDPRWDRQTEERESYLAGLIRQLGLPLEPVEQHLNGYDGEDPEDIALALQVLAVLPFAGRPEAACVLRRYVRTGKHWAAAVEAISESGALELPGIWHGLASDVTAAHDDRELDVAVGAWEPWVTFAGSQPRIRVLTDARAPVRRPSSRADAYKAARQRVRGAVTADLLRDIAAGGLERRLALEELGRRGDPVLLDLAEDPGLRNAAGWVPGLPGALENLGSAAVARAREWVQGNAALAAAGIRVLASHGERDDVPPLLDALRQAMARDDWCSAEIPARGLGRLQAGEAAPDLEAAWEETVHSIAREAFLSGLRGCAPHTAETLAEEGLYDCESSVQKLACTIVPGGEPALARLRELAADPLAPDVHDAARARLGC